MIDTPRFALRLTDLEGRWFIQQSNFPMWLKGDKQYPTFDYVVKDRAGGAVLNEGGEKTGFAVLSTSEPLEGRVGKPPHQMLDTVGYETKGVAKTIRGVDTLKPGSTTSFVWRGAGWLSLITSHWDVLFVDTARGWAVIHFTKTLFTPEGYDVVSRAPAMDETTQQQVRDKLKELGITATLSPIAQR